MKNKIEKLDDSIIIDERYQMYKDGTIYDTEKAEDIPQWIFEFRDFVKEIEKKRILEEIGKNEKRIVIGEEYNQALSNPFRH